MSRLCKKLSVLLVLLIVLPGCKGLFGRPIEEEASTPTPIPTPIVPDKPTYVVQQGEVVKQLEFTGRISSVEETTLYFKTGGYVKRVLVERDEQVKAGDLLAELEIDDLLKQMAQAEVSLNSAQLRLDEAEKSLERQIANGEWTLEIAQVNLEEAEKANERQIVEAQRALEIAQIRLEEAEKANEQQIAGAQQTLEIAQIRLEEAEKANERQIAEAQRTLEIAQIRLTQLQEGLDPADIELLQLSLDRAKNNLWNVQIERDAVRGRSGTPGYILIQIDIAVSNAEIAVREAELRHQQALQAASQDDVRLQQIEVERAKTTLAQLQEGVDPLLSIEVQRAQQELAQLEEGVDPLLSIEVERAQQELAQLEEGVNPLLSIDVQRAQQALDWLKEGVDPVLVNEVNQAQLTLERLQAQVADAQIVAPIDGRILSLSIYAGRPVEAFKTAIIVADPAAVEVSADLSGSQLEEMIEGQKAIVTLTAYPGETWDGTVRRLPYPYGTGGGTEGLVDADMSTRISLEGDLSDLELGDLARVLIVLERKDNVLWLPPESLRTFQGRQFVIVQDGERQRRVDVTVGIESQDRVEIKEGLEEGQIIVGQ
jgi:multidrug resistance efflux pump